LKSDVFGCSIGRVTETRLVAPSLGEAGPVSPRFFPDRKVSTMRDTPVTLDKTA